MADRSVVIRLLAKVEDYKRAMREAEKATEGVGKKTEETSKKSESALGRLAQHARDNEEAWNTVGTSLLAVGVAAGAGVGAAVTKFAQFDKQMSAVQAATLASAQEMEGLRAVAIKAGQDTAYSAQEAAGGIEQLAKAGVDTKDIIGGGLAGALSLAAAGELEVADAAEIAASTMVQFGLAGEDVGMVADALAAGANKAQGSVQDLGLALSYAGVPAAALGLTVEETTGVLGLFANAGITGEKAGTALRAMLVSLQNPSEKARTLMEELGVQVFDAEGKFIGMEATAGVLQDRLGGLTDEQRGAALATIFGNESLGAATTLYNGGSAAVDKWTAAVSESGYAAEVASTRLDNLSGDVTILRGSLETAFIGLGEAGSGPLRTVTQDLTTLVNEFSGLDDEVQGGVLAVGAVTSGLGLAGGAAFLATPKILAANAALASMGPAGAKAAGGLSAASRAASRAAPLVAALSVVGYLAVDQWVDQKQAVDEYASSLDTATGAVTRATRELAIKALQDENAFEIGRELGLSQKVITDAALENERAMREVADATRAAQAAQEGGTQKAGDWSRALAGNAFEGENLALNADRLNDILGTQNGRLAEARDQARDHAVAMGETARVSDEARVALFGLTGAAESVGVVAAEAVDPTLEMGGAIEASGEQSDEARERIEEWQKTLGGIADSFMEPLSVYTGLLADKEEAEQAAAQATADATEDAEDSWEDYVSGVSVSLDEYAAELEAQNEAQETWRANLVEVTERGGLEVAQILAGMGAEGAQITADMADATDAEFTRMAEALIADARFGGAGAVAEMDNAMRIMEEVSKKGAYATKEAISEQLGIGVDEVANIAARYGITLADGVNPLLGSLGKAPIRMVGGQYKQGSRTLLADGGVMPGYTPGVDVHDFYSPTGGRLGLSGGEAVMRPEWTRAVGADYVNKANMAARTGQPIPEVHEHYATGGIRGFTDAASVPKPYSTDPYRTVISTPGKATMDAGYEAVTEWLKTNAPAGGDLVSIGRWLQAKGARVSGHPAFGGVTPGAHSPTSLHYRNRAIDVNYGPGGANATENAFIRGVLPTLLSMARFQQVYYREIGGRSDHDDHLHLGLARGGIIDAPKGSLLNPHVRDKGGPLLEGLTLNATGGPETVIPGRVMDAGAAGGRTVVIERTVNVRTDGTEVARQIARETVVAQREMDVIHDTFGGVGVG